MCGKPRSSTGIAARITAISRAYSKQNGPSHVSKAIGTLLRKPSWSVKSMLPDPKSHGISSGLVSGAQMDRLLKLSALPKPKDSKSRQQMLSDLEDQIHFVEKVQQVDTTGVAPLRSITSEQESTSPLIYEEAADYETSLGAEQYQPEQDYVKMATSSKNRYYVVSGGLVRSPTSGEDSKG